MLWFVLFALLALHSVNGVVVLTGDAERDFNDESFDPVSQKKRNFGIVRVPDGNANFGVEAPDVGVPQQLGSGTLSGWDIRAIYFQYNDLTDELLIGVDCYGVCGDADGDGREGVASAELAALGGSDLPGMARGEGFAIVLDFDLNVADVLPSFVPNLLVPFDYVIGVPAGQPAEAVAGGAVEPLPCSIGKVDNDRLNLANCFGVYEYQLTTDVALARRFLRPAMIDGQVWPARNAFAPQDAQRPDLEWVIGRITELRATKGTTFTISNREPWVVLMQAFSGSFLDAGVGEDYLPSQTNFIEVPFPCLELDACDVCLGDSSTCLDCAGIPNGPNVYDVCDVCGGDGTTCLDCLGAPNGAAVYDLCDVCDGDSSTCLSCAGVPNGPEVYDLCDVCDGDDSTCRDCLGVVNGPNVYDVCGVCAGDGTTCFDCAGVPLGTCEYDACDVCCGDGTTCLDCADVPFGTCKYDNCGVCCGDGSSCVCLKIHECPTVEVDHALLEWSLVATMDRIEHTVDVLEGIKAELCRYDVSRGNLATDLAGYLGIANEFRDILDNYCYVQVWFKDTLDEALSTTL